MIASSSSTSDETSMADLEKAVPTDQTFNHSKEYSEVTSDPATANTPGRNAQSKDQPSLNVDDWAKSHANPFNWPTWKRWYHALVPALMGFAV